MQHYHIYGLHLISSIAFPQLVPEKDVYGAPDIVIEEDCICDNVMLNLSEKKWIFGDKYTCFYNKTGWYEITEGRRIKYQMQHEGNEQSLRTFLLGLALSMLFMQRNELSIHCSAVGNKTGAVLIAGESGIGKSTLTIELLKEGFSFIADDMVVVKKDKDEKTMVYPAFPYQKVCRDVILREGYKSDKMVYIDEDKDKFLIPTKNNFSVNPLPLKLLVVLIGYDGDIAFKKKIEGIDKVKAVSTNLFLRNFFKYEKTNPYIFQQCLEIASQIDIYAIFRPYKVNTVKQIKELVRTII